MTTELNIATAQSQLQAVHQPDWLRNWQQQGMNDFSAQPWPTRKTEAWKYTPLKSLLDIDWQKRQLETEHAGVRFDGWNEIRLDLVNGQLQGAPTLPAGVTLRRFSELSETEGKALLKRIDDERADFLFDSLNQGALDEGYWLQIDAGVQVAQSLQLNYISAGEATMNNVQLVVDLGQNATLTLAETFSSDGAGPQLVNPNTALFLAEGARLTHYHLMLEEGDVRHLGRVSATLNRYARLTSFSMAIGGVLKRKDIVVRHRGEGAELSLNGVYLPKGQELIDFHTTLEHEVPHCQSEEIFRGIIGDRARAVFNGRIHIHRDAQKSVAEMNNRNLLLSPNAEIDTKPELEIYADDVRCAHGATIAQLDESLLFYFQARGISRAEAEVMLSFGFINELLDALADEPVQLLLRPMLATLFAQKQEELARHLL